MASKPKVTKQPSDSAQLKEEVHGAVAEAESDAKTGNVATAKEPADTAPPAYQGHDRR